MSTMTNDPTEFRPMKVTAGRETEVGFEIEPITKKVTLDKMRLYRSAGEGWPRVRNHHNDWAAAAANGLKNPIIMGSQVCGFVGEMLVKFFGKGYLGGHLSLDITRTMEPDSEITVKGIVREKVAEGDAIRLILDVHCVNQRGEEVTGGIASGLVH